MAMTTKFKGIVVPDTAAVIWTGLLSSPLWLQCSQDGTTCATLLTVWPNTINVRLVPTQWNRTNTRIKTANCCVSINVYMYYYLFNYEDECFTIFNRLFFTNVFYIKSRSLIIFLPAVWMQLENDIITCFRLSMSVRVYWLVFLPLLDARIV